MKTSVYLREDDKKRLGKLKKISGLSESEIVRKAILLLCLLENLTKKGKLLSLAKKIGW